MSKLTKGLLIGSLAAGIAALAGSAPVSASSYGHDYKKPSWGGYAHYGSFSHNNVSFNEHYDKTSSFFFSLKQDEKKQHNEHYSSDSKNHYGGGWGGYGNSVNINYHKDMSSYKSLEETEKKHSRESYDSKYKQHNDRKDYGGKHGGSYASNHVSASVNFKKEYDYAASVKAVAAHSSSVSSNVSLNNYGPHGGYSNHVSAYENHDNYSKVEASVAEKVKLQNSESYNADNNYGSYGKYGGGNHSSNSVDYRAASSYEASREIKYSAEEKNSYSSGFESNTASYNKDHDYNKKHY